MSVFVLFLSGDMTARMVSLYVNLDRMSANHRIRHIYFVFEGTKPMIRSK